MGARLIPLLLLLSACTTTAPTDARAVWCELNAPLRFTAQELESMSRESKEQVVAHNEKGAAWCGWVP